MTLKARSALVTGASRGIGLAISQRLASEGCSVLMADIDAEAVEAAAEAVSQETGSRAVASVADVTRKEDAVRLVDEAISHFGGLDVLINNAGVIQIKPWLEITEDDWDRIFDVNLKGTFLMCQQVAPHMKERGGGRIVNLASNAARGRAVNSLHYGAAKLAVIYLTQTIALDLGPHGINVNAIAPGVVAATRLWDEIGAGYTQHFGKGKEQRISELVEKLPLRRPQTPEDVAAAALFLVSEEAREVTGICLDVDGGAAL